MLKALLLRSKGCESVVEESLEITPFGKVEGGALAGPLTAPRPVAMAVTVSPLVAGAANVFPEPSIPVKTPGPDPELPSV